MATANITSDAMRATEAKAASRWWMPSLTDVFFLAIIFTLFLSDPAGWDRLVWDGDTGLHTRTGDFILDHGHVPTVDPFSFTKPGERWFAFQWLTGVVFAQLNRWVGLKGIVLLAGVVIAATFLILLRNMLFRGANGLVSMLLVLLVGNAMSIHFHARPHIFTLFFLAILQYQIARDLKRQTPWFWMIVPLMLLWTNMHSGFPAGLVTLGILVAGCGIHALTGKATWQPVRRYAIALALCSGATLVNPNGLELYKHISQFLNNPWILAHIDEYQPPVFHSEAMYYSLAILFAALISVRGMIDRQQWAEIGWVLVFGAGSLVSARHVPVFLVVAAPFVAVEVSDLMARAVKAMGPKSIIGVLQDVADKASSRLMPASAWSGIAVIAIALFSTTFPKDLSAKYFPRDMVTKHQAELASSHVFTTDQWGDYLLWRNYPQQRVFMDGRSDFFQQSVGDEYLQVESALGPWEKTLAKYDVTLAMIPNDIRLADALRGDAAWQLVDQDPQALLFKKR